MSEIVPRIGAPSLGDDISTDKIGALFRLDGRVAVVTGAAAGLGFQMARAFGAAGARVAVHGRDHARVSAAAARIPGAVPVVFDLTDTQRMRAEVEALAARLGRLDILVGNAGLRDRRTLLETSTETLRALVETNLVGHFELARLAVPHMLTGGGGRIIFVTTAAVQRGTRRGSTYAASKGALDALTRSLANELGGSNILVNAISPGFFATEFNTEMVKDAAIARRIERSVPQKRWGAPYEVIGAALLLASDAGSYINGQTLSVDGGLSTSS